MKLQQSTEHTANCYSNWLANKTLPLILQDSYESTCQEVRSRYELASNMHKVITAGLKENDYPLHYSLYMRYKGFDMQYDPLLQTETKPLLPEHSQVYYISRSTRDYIICDIEQSRSFNKTLSDSSQLTFSRWSCFLLLDNGYLFVTGGKPSKNEGSIRRAFFVDTEYGEVITAPNMLMAHSSHIFVKVGCYVYAISGKSAANIIQRASERFNLTESVWESTADITIGRTCAANCNLGDFIYVFGGYETRVENSIEQYSISQNTWSLFSIRLPEKMWQSSAFPLNSHQILIFGGESNTDDFQRTSFIYDTTDSTFDHYSSYQSNHSFLYFWVSTIRRRDCLYMANKGGVVLEYSIARNRWRVYTGEA